MWTHPATQRNVAQLREFGYLIVEPEVGELASGLTGIGRLAEPSSILEAVERLFARAGDLEGLHVVVSAGGTREPLDPVRFIGNRSSGKMGAALAEAARDRGASVTLIAGAMSVTPPRGVTVVDATTAPGDARGGPQRGDQRRHPGHGRRRCRLRAGPRQPAQDQALRREPPDRARPEPRHRRRGRRDARRRAPVPHRLRGRVERPRGERRRQAARQGPRPDRRQRGGRAVRRRRLRREQGHRLRRRGRADRLADASQAPGRRAAVGPDRRPIPTRPTAGAMRRRPAGRRRRRS